MSLTLVYPSQLPKCVTFFPFNRSGRFVLQSPENILPPAALMDCEEALNKGGTSATEVFSSLRTRSILHLFGAAGRFFGLKVVTVFLVMSRLFQLADVVSSSASCITLKCHHGMHALVTCNDEND